MKAGDIQRRIRDELGGDLSCQGSHNLDLRKCLVEPRRVLCRNTFPQLQGGQPLPMWLVLEECPGTNDGYAIVFDEASGRFGLAVWAGSELTFIGYHGSFISTLEGM